MMVPGACPSTDQKAASPTLRPNEKIVVGAREKKSPTQAIRVSKRVVPLPHSHRAAAGISSDEGIEAG
jgi:hypothetical protein